VAGFAFGKLPHSRELPSGKFSDKNILKSSEIFVDNR
jgi:hypothetical protein